VFDTTSWSITDFQFVGANVERWQVVYDPDEYEIDIDEIYDTTIDFELSNYSSEGGTEKAYIRADALNSLRRFGKSDVCTISVVIGGKRYLIKTTFVESGTFTRYGSFFMTEPVNGSYNMIEAKSDNELVFTTARYTGTDILPNYQVTITLESQQ